MNLPASSDKSSTELFESTATFTVSNANAVAAAGNRIHLILAAGMEPEIDLDYTVQAGQTNISSIVTGLNASLNTAGVSDKYNFSYRGTNLILSRKDGINFQPYKGANHTSNILFFDGVDIRTGAGREAINGATANKTLITTNGKLEVEREIETQIAYPSPYPYLNLYLRLK